MTRGRPARGLARTGGWSGCCARPASRPACLCNGRALRLISAPRGESSGWIDFRVADMVQTAGRPICAALRLLLGQPRLLTLPRGERLAALLDDSRKFQNEVATKLAEQVLHALYELLRGFQAAHDATDGELLREPLADDPDEVYHALLTVILRLLFVLYAEERDMLPAGRDRAAATTRSPACTSGCASTRPRTRTRWSSATARGRSCSSSSG